MGIFDDLIPEQNQSAASSGGGFFDDLIPSKPAPPGSETSVRPQARPSRFEDETDDARSTRNLGNSAYDSGLVDRPDVMVPQNPLGSVDDQLDTMRRREATGPVEESQPTADLGSRFARGATEVGASLPEAAAIAGRGIVESRLPTFERADPALREEMEALQATIQEFGQDSPRGRAAGLRLKAVAGELNRAGILIERDRKILETPLTETELFKSGDRIRAASEEIFGTPDPKFDDRFISKLSEGGGSMAGFVGVTLLTGVGGGAASGSALNASGMYRRALQEGANEEQARTAAYLGAFVGASEVVPIGRALDMLPAKSRGRVANAIGRRLADAFSSAGEEGAQEAMTEIANNMIARGIWKPDQDVFEGAGEAALIGAILGGGLGAITSTPSDDERLSSPRLTQADRASALPNSVIDDGKAAIEEMLTGATPPDIAAKRQGAPQPSLTAPDAPLVPSTAAAPVEPAAPARPDVMTTAPTVPQVQDESLIPVVGEDGKETGDFVRFNEETGQVEKAQPQVPMAPTTDTAPAIPADAQPMPAKEGPEGHGKTQTDFDREVEIAAARRLRARAANPDLDLIDEARSAMIESAVEIEQKYGVAPPVEVKTRRPGPATLQKRPLAQEIKGRELAVKPGSPLAKELNARGINTRTHPGLFNSTGVSDWDNLPAEQWQNYRHELGEDGNGYLNQQGLIDALESEMRGEPLQVGEQALLQAAADADEAMARFEAAEPDDDPIDLSEAPGLQIVIPDPEEDISDTYQRFDMVRRGVDAVLQEVGLSEVFSHAEKVEVVGHLEKQGGNVEDIIWWQIHRSAEANAEPAAEPGAKPPLASGSEDLPSARSFEPVQKVSTDRNGEQLDTGTEAGSATSNQKDRRADERQTQEPAAPEVTDPSRVPTFEDLRQSLPKDSDGFPDVVGAGQTALDKAAGTKGAQWAQLTDAQKVSAFQAVGGDLARLSQADGKPAQSGATEERPQGVPHGAGSITEATEAGEQSVIPGAEQSAERNAVARKADEGREVEARQKQSKAGTTVPQDDAGPLFDTQGDMFDVPKVDTPKDQTDLEKMAANEAQLAEDLAVEFNRVEKLKWAASRKTGRRSSSKARMNLEKVAKKYGLDAAGYSPLDKLAGTITLGTINEQSNYGPYVAETVRKFLVANGDPDSASKTGELNPSTKTQKRLVEILRKEWVERENLPDAAHDEFIEQTAKVREARKAIVEEFGNDAANSALEEIEAEYFAGKKTTTGNTKPGERIEDFGEVLHGAQKHLAKDWADRANNIPDDDLANHPLSKSWPEPNYAELIKAGTDPEAVAFIHAARDEVPNKPRKGFKQNRWAEQVRLLRQMASRLASGEYTMDQIREKANTGLDGMLGRVALYQAVGHEKSLKGIRLSSSSYSLRDGVKFDPPKVFWTVSKQAKATAFSNWPREFVIAESRAEAIEKFKTAYDGLDLGEKSSGKGTVKFEIRQWRSSKQVFIGKKIGKNWVELKTFEDVKTAREFRDQNHAALLKMLEAYKATPFERSTDNAARLGVDHRNGQDASPELFQEEFGFRGVQFGNYVEGPRRQADLNEAYDALMDLAGVIGIPPKAISLNGSLGLAFGARGKGGKNAAAAHYEPGSIVINLTKKSGAGSLAHEWWHGLDNYFSRARGNNAGYVSNQPYFRGEGVRPEVTDQFKAVMKAIHATNLKIRSSELDKRRTKEYWSTPIEMSARSFESYVIGKLQDQSGANDYLANVLSKEAWDALEALQGHESKQTYPYITASEMPAIRGAFDGLFDVIKTEETDHGVRMYQEKSGEGAEADMQVLANLMPALQERLDKLMIRGVDLRLAPDLFEQGATEFGPDGITILIGNTLDGVHTVNHEAIHILRARGLINDAEWDVLSTQAESEWIQKYDIEERYPDLDHPAQIEEAIAEAFADHVDGRASRGKIATIFAKVQRFFRAMREALLGQGVRSVEDIFEAVDTGKVGARGQDAGATGETRHQRPSSKVRKLKPEGVQSTAVATHTSAIPDDSRFEKFRRVVQDRMLILRRMREITEEDTGQKISKEKDPYFAEERYSGRVGDRLEDIDANYTKPIIDLIAKAPETIKVADHKGETREGAEAASLWLMARHAKERNAHIASINDQMPDGGSGLKNAEADAILKSAAPFQATLDQIGALTDKLGQQMITTREDAGLLSAKDALIWRRMYKHYVPLQKFAEDDMFDGVVNDRGTAMGRKFNVRGKEQQTAMGRSTEAFDPLATLLTQAMEVTVRAEKNAVAKVMYNFAVFNPNPAMYEISAPETQRYFDKATGKVETRVVGPAARQLAENEMALKVNGKEYRITFNDPRLAEALGQLGTNEMGKVTSIASVFSRYFSSINTMLSPSFIAINALRDMMTAQVNLGGAGGGISGKLRKAAMRDYVKALRGSYRAMSKHKHDTEYSKWFKEYSEAGGKVHFWKVENPEGQSVDFRKRVKRASRGKVLGTVSSLALPSTRDNPALSMIENVNLAVDNAVRLATYVEARKNGWSKADAASLSKNLTVNFNRRGEIGATMNAWYPFANAAIQGSHVILKAMKSREVKGIVGGMILFGFLNDLLAATLSERDEDGELEYDQLPAYKSERNIIVATPLGDEKYITIPLPYGYNVFFFAGQQLGKITRGVKDPGEAAAQMLMATIGAFSPISGETGFTMVAPTVLDFINEFDNNQDWLGRPIRPENPYGDYGPQSYKEFNATGISRLAARGMNTATGGSPLEPGLIDVSPEYIDHFFKFMTGGAGRFVGKTYGLAERVAEGTLDQTEAYEIPIARSFITESGDFLNQSRYFDFRDAVQEARAQQKLAAESGHPMTQEMKDLNALWVHLRSAEKERKRISGKLDGIYSNTSYSSRQREQRLTPLKDERNDVYIGFNRRYIAAMGPQAE